MAVAAGVQRLRWPAIRRGILLLVILSYVSSITLYFRRQNFLNLGYVAPLPEIAAMLNSRAQPRDLILIDYYNTDSQALEMYLSGHTPIVVIDQASAAAARRAMRSARTVWIVRNTRDISPADYFENPIGSLRRTNGAGSPARALRDVAGDSLEVPRIRSASDTLLSDHLLRTADHRLR